MFKIIARYAPAVAAFGVLTSAALDASAESADHAARMPSVTVRYADLDLNTPSGVEALYGRVRAAARQVCGVGERRALAGQMESKRCYEHALGAATDTVEALASSARDRGERRVTRAAGRRSRATPSGA